MLALVKFIQVTTYLVCTSIAYTHFTTVLSQHKPSVSVVGANECLIFLSLAIRLRSCHSLLLGAFLLIRLLRSLGF